MEGLQEKRLATVSIIPDLQKALSDTPAALDAIDNQAVEIIITHNLQAMSEKIGEIRANSERDAGYLGAYLYYLQKEGGWKKSYATWQDFCNAQVARGYTTVLDLVNNYEWYVIKTGYDQKRFFRLTRKVGWTVLREMRLKKLDEKLLDKTVEEIEAKGLTREEVKAKLDKATHPGELTDPDEGETRKKEWQKVWFNLPMAEYDRLMEAVEDIVKTQGVKDLAQAIMYLVTDYWKHV